MGGCSRLVFVTALLAFVSCGRGGGEAEDDPGAAGETGTGRGGEIQVTNLDDNGSGSLRDCAEGSGTRTCIFSVAGKINLKSDIIITSGRLTIAGDTAPDPGIRIHGAGLHVRSSNVRIQHLEIRPGDDRNGPEPSRRRGVTMGDEENDVGNVSLDHLSVSWAIDENLDVWCPGTHDVTISHCIVSEGLQNSLHPKGGHSKGILVGEGATNVSINHSLLAHNYDRNPGFQDGTSGEFINNVVYNWGGGGAWDIANMSDTDRNGRGSSLNFEGNYFKAGPDSIGKAPLFCSPCAESTRVYAARNIGPTRPSDKGDEWTISNIPERNRRSSPVEPRSSIQTSLPQDTFEYVLGNAGSRPWNRNPVDVRIINDVRKGTGRIKDCVSGCRRAAM